MADGTIFIFQARAYQYACSIAQPTYTPPDLRGVWLHGFPGSGKTCLARFYPDVYIKVQNKWWDGYNGEKVVVLDDLDTPVLYHYLKIWVDRYSCSGEIKGGTTQFQYDYLIITCNLSIE